MSFKRLLVTLYLTTGLGNLSIYQIMEQAIKAQKEFLTGEELLAFGRTCKNFQQKRVLSSYLKIQQEDHLIEKILKTPFLPYWDSHYPIALKEMYQFPVLLFYRGDLNLLKTPALGVVGTRAPLTNRKEILESLLLPLMSEWSIVSGLAKGVDATSHQICLENGGKTIAVLGTGLDIIYPKENKDLQEKIAQNGLLLSEYLPEVGPKRHHFPLRNRIIAGLSQGVLVLGAKERSGSLITVDWALEHNKEVFVVPGPILDKNYKGSLSLIQQGAKCVFQTKDILEELIVTKGN